MHTYPILWFQLSPLTLRLFCPALDARPSSLDIRLLSFFLPASPFAFFLSFLPLPVNPVHLVAQLFGIKPFSLTP
jgi:hypothetical protein